MKDKFLKNKIKKIEIEKPSQAFTENIMQQINNETLVESVKEQSVMSWKYWILLTIGLLSVIFLLFAYDWSFINNVFSGIRFENLNFPSFILGSFNYFKEVYTGIEISSITVIVVFSVALLIFIDRVLKRSLHVNLFSL